MIPCPPCNPLAPNPYYVHRRGLRVCLTHQISKVSTQTWLGLGSSHMKWLRVWFGVGTVWHRSRISVIAVSSQSGPTTTSDSLSAVLWSYPAPFVYVKWKSEQLKANCKVHLEPEVVSNDLVSITLSLARSLDRVDDMLKPYHAVSRQCCGFIFYYEIPTFLALGHWMTDYAAHHHTLRQQQKVKNAVFR